MTGVTTSSAHSSSEPIQAALELPDGARFYRCALQVNPFAYLARHGKQTLFQSESDYNKAMVEACLANEIEVIGVTDHYRVQESWSLVRAARDAGIRSFGGVEAVSKEGVHFLCLFDPEKDEDVERFIGSCGIRNSDQTSPIGDWDSTELLTHARQWGAVCIAAHVVSKGGLLKKLSGQSRINVWKSPHLLACTLAGPVGDAPEGFKPILRNKNADYRRTSALAILNAADVNDPADLTKEGSSCFIKMSAVSVEGFRQAFLDPESRIRLHSDPHPEPHVEFLAMTWEGGFLRDTAVHFNGNLNAVVGGRGTGKSTLIESIRYVLGLDPLGDEARKAHEGVIRHVLKSGTKVSLLVRSHSPSVRCYTLERSVPNPPIVKDETGEVLAIAPGDVVPGVQVFGQHEISELTQSPEKLTLLLERFVDRDPSLSGRKAGLRLELERSRGRIVEVQREMLMLEERLAALPGLEETQKRFQQAGLEERLNEKGLLIREERLLATLDERLDPFRALHRDLTESLPIDAAFVSSRALNELPNAEILEEVENIFATLSTRLDAVGEQFAGALSEADIAFSDIRTRWQHQRDASEETYQKLLRDLQASDVDGAEFVQLRQQIEELRPLKDRLENLQRGLLTHEAHRRQLLSEWEDLKGVEYRTTQDAAEVVSSKLRDQVRVTVEMAGNRAPLEQVLREVGGNLSVALDRLRKLDQLSLLEFAQRCREGKESLRKHYSFPPGAAERIAQAGPDLFMRIEELDLPATTQIELNTAAEGSPAAWQSLESLSSGQKATAVLLLLLLESEAPLVVDQPEDDLDNRFISERIVPIMRQEKRRRQFVFSTHNANIPVLGDAELILGLTASGEAAKGRAELAPEHMGSIDSRPVRELVEEILEGGKDAFEMRRSKYGF